MNSQGREGEVKGRSTILYKSIRMTRRQLYDLVWEDSMSGVAKKYELNYDQLFRTVRDENIPHPDNSYLIRRNHGQDVSDEKEPLPGDPQKMVQLSTTQPLSDEEVELASRGRALGQLQQNAAFFSFLPDDLSRQIVYLTEHIRLCSSEEMLPAVSGYLSLIPSRISKSESPRAGCILSSLIHCLHAVGAEVQNISPQGIELNLFQVPLTLKIRERSTQRRLPDASAYRRQFNGRLELQANQEIQADQNDLPLERKLSELFIWLLTICASSRNLPHTADAPETKSGTEQSHQQIEDLFYETEMHRLAESIRIYVDDVQQQKGKEVDRNWIDWALRQADQIDPLMEEK